VTAEAPLLAGLRRVYFWFQKMTGRMMDDRLGELHFWLAMIGFHTTFLVQHWLGAEGMLPVTPNTHRRVHHPEHRLDDRGRSSWARR
jgi:heme/copper-type cytochrome/quinol oxidase subunit 1